jgi:hypothetical protein
MHSQEWLCQFADDAETTPWELINASIGFENS